MPLHRTRYRGRHVAPRRHVAAPFLLTGLLVGTTATVGVPQTAQAFDYVTRPRANATDSALTSVSATTERTERVSRAAERAALTTPAPVVKGKRLKPKPPPPWVLPVQGYHLTARFGAYGLWSSSHTGLDFAAPSGTTIRSIAPGTVVSSSYDGAYGNKTVIRLLDGTEIWYCHQTESYVGTGERVVAGQSIGSVGSTGNVTGPHLHLEVHPGGGDPVDPEAWLPEHDLNP